jgi:hypothetical protein
VTVVRFKWLVDPVRYADEALGPEKITATANSLLFYGDQFKSELGLYTE